MTNPRGFNPMVWNCVLTGCHLHHRHYNIEYLKQCFPRDIALGDLDGFVEVGGRFLITEFKGKGADVTTGQRIAFERLSALSEKIVVLVIRCDYTTGEIFEMKPVKGGKSGNWTPCDFEQLVRYLTAWAERAQGAQAA